MKQIVKVMIILMILLMVVFESVSAQEIMNIEGKHIFLVDDSNLSLVEKVKRAEIKFSQQCQGDYFLTGYQFDARSNAKISGTYINSQDMTVSKISHQGDRLRIRHYGSCIEEHESGSTEKVERILILLNNKEGQRSEVTDITVLTRNYSYGIEKVPLFWLGKVAVTESFNYLKQLFRGRSSGFSKRLLAAIAIHDHPRSMDFLYEVAAGTRYPVEIRRSAVFWMGVVRDKAGLAYLLKLNSAKLDLNIRKQLVFALYLNGSTEAVQGLIKIAKNDSCTSLRKKAIFWMGQKASKECEGTLKDVLENDDEESVKSSAVFAISQLPKTRAIPILIQIARENENPRIRRKAIFWLGEIGDERVIKFFEEILLK